MTAAEVRYRLLGPLSVTVDGRDLAVTAGRDRIVLAMLLLHAGRVLGVGALADAVWGADPPATAKGQLQTCVSRLRRLLPEGAIRSDPAGYCLTPGPGELDAADFARLIAEARERQDVALYRRALDLWRGDAAAGIDSHGVLVAAAGLDKQHLAALEAWAELAPAAGDEPGVIGELSAAVDRFPLSERLSGHLMRALYRDGRQADALAEFRRLRVALREEFGLDPGRDLQDLHTSMLTGAIPAAAGGHDQIRCLPRTVGDFTGRDELVRRLVGAIDTAGDAGPVTAVIDGMAGSGKTTLALHLATLIGERYADAHLFVDLRGHHAEQPLEPSAALLVLLRQLGVPAERIPPEQVDRIGLWRTELAQRRVLVLFDNAGSSAQVAELLPTGPGSLALITSRRRLAGLDGVQPVSLPLLATAEAVALLARIAGDRVRAEPEAATEVARRCGGLPLAVRLAGARLAHRPRWRVADLVRRLDREAALPELAAEERSVASAFAVSYRQLPAVPQRVFRLLGACPAADFDALSVAALSGLPLADAGDALDDLVDVHLVEEPEPEIYRMHDLLREFAGALAGETPQERTEALRGALDQQLHAAVATNLPAYREGLDRDIGTPAPLRPDLLAALTDPAGRLERERLNLGPYVDAAAATPELEQYAWKLPRAAWRLLFVRAHLDIVLALQTKAWRVAERLGDRPAIATTLNYLASVYYRRSEMDEAARLLERCIAIRREEGGPAALALALNNLAALHSVSGRWGRSIEILHEVRRLPRSRRMRDDANILATSYDHLGRYTEALRYYRLRLLMQIEIGDPTRIGDTLVSIAVVKYRAGQVTIGAARRQVSAGLRMQRRASYPYGIALAESTLAGLNTEDGRFAEAVAGYRRAIEAADQLRDPAQTSLIYGEFGRALRRAGDPASARPMAEQALRLGRQSGLPYAIALAEAALGECLTEADPREARRLLSRARVTLAELEAVEMRDVEKRLLDLGGEDHLRTGPGGETMEG
ncbi:SARP family transcriptional regulator [Paractinoplanes abujensis]|uniref:DNA-binding SARP family transcriptional activator/tetratricopeptide (TPR) repeat protein n=1 Tax=Paractinoplanes abujensis TaxID=882441 RepID=A0A7W7G3N3_9ACTN|nr:BTAD domain-containing putative transcriptional regulator [Actinoplanes abujensis]MBB4696473.1 DNA-binding SARP family transcriptional activator/tetratricopeptide (TPR) repeat protein [Actinoplanes abujensis]GID22469.1 SARP family transcriptional regulator [Actinoplanes abujensis]